MESLIRQETSKTGAGVQNFNILRLNTGIQEKMELCFNIPRKAR